MSPGKVLPWMMGWNTKNTHQKMTKKTGLED